MRTMRAFAAAAATIGALAVAPASANAAYWVGLGDSFAAGPLIPSQTLNPLGCLRSTRNYARLASAQLGVSLKDASCSGAETAEMTTPQSDLRGHEPAAVRLDRRRHAGRLAADRRQRHRLHRDPHRTARPRTRSGARARTSTCATAWTSCATGSRPRRRRSRPCSTGIKARTSRADPVLNYEAILPSSGSGCWPQVPIAWADVPYVRGIQLELNTMIAAQGPGGPARARGRVHGEPRQGRVQGLGHALGRAAGAGQRRGAVPPQRPRHEAGVARRRSSPAGSRLELR